MKLYLLSLVAGILVGAIYAVLTVKSPAPPIIALIGLLGMLIGEQSLPVARRILSNEPLTARWFAAECAPKMMGTPTPVAAAQTESERVQP
jgi:XapX domain-containing protein